MDCPFETQYPHTVASDVRLRLRSGDVRVSSRHCRVQRPGLADGADVFILAGAPLAGLARAVGK